MVIRIFTCIWKRPEVAKAFMWHLNYLRDETGLELPISIAYSSDDDLQALKDSGLISKNDHLIKLPNAPLGDKWNGLVESMLELPFDYAIQIGSDDFMSAEYVMHLHENPCSHGGVNEYYAYSPIHNKAVRTKYEDTHYKIKGAGRIFSRKALLTGYRDLYKCIKKCYQYDEGGHYYVDKKDAANLVAKGVLSLVKGYTKYKLWDSIPHGLDNNSEDRLRKSNYRVTVYDFDKPQITELKSLVNIHPFEEFQGQQEVDVEEATWMFLNGMSFATNED